MSAATMHELLQLPPSEREAIADQLYESLENEISELTPEQECELDRRIQEFDRNPGKTYTWEEIEAELVAKYFQ